MINGAIEYATSEEVAGWVYSPKLKMRDCRVLAFVDDNCVGAGTVTIFRSDLKMAGLGDGYLGFSFPVTVKRQDQPKIYIKIEDSDFILMQNKSKISSANPELLEQLKIAPIFHVRRLSALKWMLTNKAISQTSYDTLRMLQVFGVYERTSYAMSEQESEVALKKIESDITAFFETYAQNNIKLKGKKGINFDEHGQLLQHVLESDICIPIVAYVSSKRIKLNLAEGSHISNNNEKSDLTSEYIINPGNILYVDSRAEVTFNTIDFSDGVLEIFYAEFS
jgi:hypothetical protein